MGINRLLLFIISFFSFVLVDAQVIVNSDLNLTLLSRDSVWQTANTNKSLIRLNFQTGETTMKVNTDAFKSTDTALNKLFINRKTDISLHFNVNKETINLLSKDNKVYTLQVPGMLYINSHFHSVQVIYSFYNKNGNTLDLANNKIFASIRCDFFPADFQADWLSSFTSEAIKLWATKQGINFFNVD